jgi:hypothetical protein
MTRAVFEGGPYDGCELGLAGGTPAYLMLIDAPPGVDWSGPIIVGAGFDDDWPGQARYDLVGGTDDVVTYAHAGDD